MRILILLILIVFGAITECAYPQGFVNLDFESGQIPAGTPSGALVTTAAAVYGWTAYQNNPVYGTNQLPQIRYNTIDAGGGGVFIYDTNNNGYQPIAGQYSVFLHGQNPAGFYSFSLGQTGQVPADAKSLTFLVNPAFVLQVSFAGQAMPLFVIGVTGGNDIVGADISAFAGKTGQLLFTAPVGGNALLDNIQFSSAPIPEPSTLIFSALDSLLIGLMIRKKIKS